MYLEEIARKLTRPEEYVTADQDILIMQMVTEDESDNPVTILLGYDNTVGVYYLVVEDNDTSEDYYCYNKSLGDIFCDIIKDFIDKGEC